MESSFGVIVKLFLVSALLSGLIKYGGRLLPIEANTTNALIGILVLPMLMMFFLGWRAIKP